MGSKFVNKCSYFVYDKPKKTCKLFTNESSKKICDIIHGTPEPDYNTCIESGYIPWASKAIDTIGKSTAPTFSTELASSTAVVPGNFFLICQKRLGYIFILTI